MQNNSFHLPSDWKKTAAKNKNEYTSLLKKWKQKKGAEKVLPDMHEAAFEKIDCLQCAGCCKNISPRFKTPDIKRISKYLGIKESALIDKYLRLDKDGDYVVHKSPCPFLLPDNYCEIYDARPRDCANYPYTDSGLFFEYTNTAVLNTTICPAVFYVVEELKKIK